MNEEFVLVTTREKARLEKNPKPGEAMPQRIRTHQLAWLPALIRTPARSWVWGKRITRYYTLQGVRYRIFDSRVGWL